VEEIVEEEGPSDFTRIIQAGSMAGEQEDSAPADNAEKEDELEPAPQRKGMPVWLIVSLIVLGVAAVGVILYFVLKS